MGKNKNIYGIAGLTPDNDGKIGSAKEMEKFLEGFSDKDKLKDILDNIEGGGGKPAANSVGTDEIEDHSITLDDISEEVIANDDDITALFD